MNILASCAGALLAAYPGLAAGGEQRYQDPPATADEPFAKSFSALAAAQALDRSVVLWQQENRCVQCHANMHYGLARSLLKQVLPQPADYDDLLEELVNTRWKEKGLRYPMEAVVVSLPLVMENRAAGTELRPTTRAALETMLSQQRADGGWPWLPGAPRAFIREYDGALLAALTIALAPSDFRNTPKAASAIERVRGYVRQHPPASAYSEAMLLWASMHIDGLLEANRRKEIVEHLGALQDPDGGWAIENLIVGSPTFEYLTLDPLRQSDGFATGFIVYALRQAGVSPDAPRILRAVTWLESHQRESGRWFVPSLSKRPNHLLSNSGTAWAVLALGACNRILPGSELGR